MAANKLPGQEERNVTRHSLQLAARYREKPRGEWKDCIIMDISAAGIGVLLQKERPEVNAALQIRVKEIVPKTIDASGTVIWTKAFQNLNGFTCAAGLKFESLAEEDKQVLLYYLKKLSCN